LARLQGLLDKYEITIAEANDLVVLQDYTVMVIADDSGSMTGAASPSHMRTVGAPVRSRWDELKETVSSIVDIANFFSKGIDVHFLNRSPVLQSSGSMDPKFISSFNDPPRGRTPLTETLQRVKADLKNAERKTLLFVLTDGEPNGGPGPCIQALRELTATGRARVQVMVCTPEEDEVEWLNQLDKELKTVDVMDDYFTEKQQVLRSGKCVKFSRGDWIMKAMLGPISHKFDGWDEPAGMRRSKDGECDGCTIC